MEEILKLVGAGGLAILGLLAFKYLDNRNIERKQGQLEKKVGDIKQKEAGLAGQQQEEDRATKEKVDAIEKEKSRKLDLNSLADFFRNRK